MRFLLTQNEFHLFQHSKTKQKLKLPFSVELGCYLNEGIAPISLDNYRKRAFNCIKGTNLLIYLFIFKISLSCMGSPCIFGCINTGSERPICGCPNGYRTIGQGHCLSTINQMNVGPLQKIEDIETKIPFTRLPKEQSPIFNEPPYEKFLSTEGCFTCRVSQTCTPFTQFNNPNRII